MEDKIRLAHFPNEVLDMIFEHLTGETSKLRPFLYDPGTYLSAARILWRDVDVSYRKPFRKHEVMRKHLMHDFERHLYYKLMQNLNPLRLTAVRSLKVDVPVRPCGCPSVPVRNRVKKVLEKLPNLHSFDLAYFRVFEFVGQKASDHKHHVNYLYLPSHVRELTINHPRCVRWSPADIAAGPGLDQLTFRSDCVRCESHSQAWHHSQIKPDTTHSFFRNVKKFRFECSSSGMCQDPQFQGAFCGHASPAMLRTVVRSLHKGSRESLEALEVEMRFSVKDVRHDLTHLLSGINGFPNLKYDRKSLQML